MDIKQRFMTSNEFKIIQNNIKISRKFLAAGTKHILIAPSSVVEEKVILRGDLGKVITIGTSTIIDTGAVLRPSLSSLKPPFEYKPLKVGSNCYIGKNSIICALEIGKNVYIGNNCILADRVEVGSNVKILDDTYIPADTKVPDNCVFGGKPGKYLGEITESADIVMSLFCDSYYKNLVITQSAIVTESSQGN
jgi:dynactin-5